MLQVDFQKSLPEFQLSARFAVKDEIIVLFGPSGSGKTTILNCIAGLAHPEYGTIRLADRLFFDHKDNIKLPVQKRNVGYLFQDYALFPHMTVEKNIRYGMQRDAQGQVEELLQSVGIDHLLQKYPHQLSGGQKQRVALVRALATKPDILLLDEPLSALDADTRRQCQAELLRIHEKWRIPFLLVTHDRDEAERLGDLILTNRDGHWSLD
ncbi:MULTISPECIES: ATP-binding cassette domain-containing protein [Brevibacillus]|jgi:molybdate transport system ATP-binding protein|uniref:ATP-binding cassette domain-containing protein n=1 Tax=Brevibacillus TaxID=55080 RepID=UPI00046931C7|nr:ATP-binding cassette domain-containing protein [Brevibacillus borstelensis]MED1882409.1 ATP-binding cassette domain-containing protein [Brevibacillus borstelensis]RNB62431.1 ATP-binding cassette domain-containing protein [Brevibacillus borstelensis]WNF03853.1 ATP-binding cassette domain-containing protein [Brevibacillus borstelensis]GED51864.1 ABC transporter [Brevibacillus borstelensis]